MEKKKSSKRYPSEVKQRAVRLVHESLSEHPSEWAAIKSIASKIGCTPETLRTWIRLDAQKAQSPSTTDDAQRIKELERELRELRQANEILRKASAFFAQAELDRPLKKW